VAFGLRDADGIKDTTGSPINAPFPPPPEGFDPTFASTAGYDLISDAPRCKTRFDRE
jgi:hypothetical protein